MKTTKKQSSNQLYNQDGFVISLVQNTKKGDILSRRYIFFIILCVLLFGILNLEKTVS